MRILLTGATGFIGQALVPALRAHGHELVLLTRQRREDTPGVTHIGGLGEIEGTTAVGAIINLAGASLAGRRWSAAYKREIYASRIETTEDLVRLIARLETPPGVFISGSAVGYYGHHPDTLLDEDSPVVHGFAQSLCADWEAAALEAEALGVRTCRMRLGVVLARGGGALREMSRSFQFGVGSWIGSGEQWLSWVHRDDVVAAIIFLLNQSVLTGPFNLTAPQPVTARAFAEALSAHYRLLFSAPVPASAARLLLGEMADELLLTGQRVIPARLQAAGFEFRYPTVASALQAIYQPA
ncbi:TIGR01777 family oxidoreductase [Haliea sp. E17]|uniref:TIGR01777 family oxidoreductase n=1 Tax=Haliea sp. E17 TaxID=3401576 RepID=UPI003AAD1E2E